jgi:Uma2 family endonuclease
VVGVTLDAGEREGLKAMVQAIPKLLAFEEFLDWKPEEGRYELIRGHVVEMQPTGKHEEIVEFLDSALTVETHRLKLPYRFPKQALVKIPETETGYLPDVLVVDRHALATEPLWEKASTITQGSSVPLVIEVVSTNWRDDYGYKLNDYEALGISEYWIVDHAALGAVRYIGSPKQPTISIYRLVDDEYQVRQYRGNEQILSQIFPELKLTANQIFRAEL